ncbi:MAG: glycosyltransferase family 87 protein [Vicinamibacterales bacterium]
MTIQRPLEHAAVRRASALALAVLVVVFAAQTWRKAYRPDGNDLTSYLAASRALAEGSSPYEVASPFPYIYPLFPALALIPLAAVPYGVAVLLWFALSVAALGWTLALFARRETPDGRLADAVPIAAIVLFLLIEVVQNNLLNGQVNFVVLACSVAAVRAGATGFRAAAWWGTAIATKILPLGLAPWWLLRRRPLVVMCAIGIAVALALAPVLVAGRATLEWTAAYAQGFVGPSFGTGVANDTLRFSLYGVIGPFAPWVPWLPLECALIVIGAAAVADARRRSGGDDHVAYAIYLAAIPLASPKSETHHLAFALPAAYVCALRMLRYRVHLGDWRWRTVSVSVVVFWAGSLVGPVRNWCWFGALILLCGATAGLMFTEARESTESDTHGDTG